jgi:hypothetical protein
MPGFSRTYDVRLLFAVLFPGRHRAWSWSTAPVRPWPWKSSSSDAFSSSAGAVRRCWASWRWWRAAIFPSAGTALDLSALAVVPGAAAGRAHHRPGPFGRRLAALAADGIVSFQPMEPARLGLIIYLAYSLSKKQAHAAILQHRLRAASGGPGAVQHPLIAARLRLGRHLRRADLADDVRRRRALAHLLSVLLLTSAVGVAMMLTAPYRIAPDQFSRPLAISPAGEGYQVIHSMMAFGTWAAGGAPAWEGAPETVLPARAAYRFRFFRDRRRDGILGRAAHPGALHHDHLWRGSRIACVAKTGSAC